MGLLLVDSRRRKEGGGRTAGRTRCVCVCVWVCGWVGVFVYFFCHSKIIVVHSNRSCDLKNSDYVLNSALCGTLTRRTEMIRVLYTYMYMHLYVLGVLGSHARMYMSIPVRGT